MIHLPSPPPRHRGIIVRAHFKLVSIVKIHYTYYSVKLDRTNNIVIIDVVYIDALTIDDSGSLRATIVHISDIAPVQHYSIGTQ